MITPTKAMIIEMKVILRKLSFKKIYPIIAAINGITANIKSVTAAVVIVIEYINPVIAVPKPKLPIKPGIPIFKKFLYVSKPSLTKK